MIIFQAKDSDGSVVIYGNPACLPTVTDGCTIREVDALPPGVGPLRWDAASGQLVRDPEPLPPVPTLTARQLRLWIIGAGISLDAVDAQISAIADATAQARARVEWDYASEYRRDHPLVIQIGTALGLDQAQIDAAFRAAGLL